MKKEIQFTLGFIGLKEHILIMTPALDFLYTFL